MIFKGYSASEMLKPLGLTVVDFEDEDEIDDVLCTHFVSVGGEGRELDAKKAAQVLRGYLAALATCAEEDGYDGPVWRGLLAVEDDYTLLSFASMLVGRMWT